MVSCPAGPEPVLSPALGVVVRVGRPASEARDGSALDDPPPGVALCVPALVGAGLADELAVALGLELDVEKSGAAP